MHNSGGKWIVDAGDVIGVGTVVELKIMNNFVTVIWGHWIYSRYYDQ